MKLLIAGGGIGGLTTALAAHGLGLEFELFEQSPVFSDIGAGVQLSPNAMKVMRALGIEPALSAVAFRPEAAEVRDGVSGKSLMSVPLGAAAETRWRAPYLHVHRADLVSVLRDTPEAKAVGRLHTGVRLHRYESDGGQVQAVMSDGQRVAGDALIGADGLHSTVRRQMLGPDAPRDTGQIAWRLVVPASRLKALPPPTACAWIGKGRHAVTYFVRGGELVNFVGVVEREADAPETWDAEGARNDALKDFAGWHETLTCIIEAAGTLYQWKLFDRAPLPRWTEGPVALLGDACHPMLPFMAQGAAMAIEDAYVLTKCLRRNADVSAALQTYKSERHARASRVHAASAANRARFHTPSIMQRAPLAAASAVPGLAAAAFDWLYGFDVTAG